MIEETHQIPPQISQVRFVVANVIDVLAAAGLSPSDCFDVKSALTEALTNAIKFGTDPGGAAGHLWYRLDGHRLIIRVTDRGPGFDWDAYPDPTSPENLLAEGGRGVFLIKHLMDRTTYDRATRTLTMEKNLSRPRGV
ncbi:MAG: ATP-binding protein [Candidatus Tectimicrobiota bacterium]